RDRLADRAAGARRLVGRARDRAADLSGGEQRAARSRRASDPRRPALAPARWLRRRKIVMSPAPRVRSATISAVVSDVDGTLVTDDKTLTAPTQAAVARLRQQGIAFAIISSRPPRG